MEATFAYGSAGFGALNRDIGRRSRPWAFGVAVSLALHAAVAAAAIWWRYYFGALASSAPRYEIVMLTLPAEGMDTSPPPAKAAPPEQETLARELHEVSAQAVPAESAPATVASIAVALPMPKPRPAKPKPTAAPAPAQVQPGPPSETTSHAVSETASTGEASPAATETANAAPVSAASPVVSAVPPLITTPRYRVPPTPPVYPSRAVDLSQEGDVVIRALVGPDGASREILLWRSSGVKLLDEAALRAVRLWAFEAASIDGRAVEAWVEVPVRFRLQTVL